MHGSKASRYDWGVLIPALSALVMRVVFALHSTFWQDQYAVYESALRFYKTGKLGLKGAAIVYTNTALPGGLLDLLVGLPLWISGGLPWGPAVFIALLNWIFVALLFKAAVRYFPEWNRRTLAWWIFWAPWTFLYTDICNPSFVPILALAFYWGVLRLMDRPKDFWGAFALAGSLAAYVQIHLSVVVLVGVLVILFLIRWVKWPRWSGLVAGALAGGWTLIPYLLDRWAAPASSSNPFLLANIHFDWVHFSHEWKIFTRVLSFPTGETTRFMGYNGGGFGRAIEFIVRTPALWIPFLVGFPLSIALTLLGFPYLFKKASYRSLWKFKLPREPRERLGGLFIIGLATLMAQYIFAIKEPSAHTFLGLLPLSFVPVLAVWGKQSRRLHPAWVAAYSLCVATYSATGYVMNSATTLWKAQSVALEQRAGTRTIEDNAQLDVRTLHLIREANQPWPKSE